MKSTILSIIIASITVASAVVFSSGLNGGAKQNKVEQVDNVQVVEGVQYVNIFAKTGYSPRNSIVKPDIPTKLVVKTENTYDCSLALVIRSVGFQKMLESTGEEVIDLGALNSGDKISGTCSMGMYSFNIKVE